ncbi:MAG: hypothetical protein J7501_06775 [Bdellovibrio sp.]|nr:hypothetical protein [Bdellovibrio sp.]
MKYLCLLLGLIMIGSSAPAQIASFESNITAGDIMRVIEKEDVVRAAIKRLRKLHPQKTWECSGLILNSFNVSNFQNDHASYSTISFNASAACSPIKPPEGDVPYPTVDISGVIYLGENSEMKLTLNTIKFSDDY